MFGDRLERVPKRDPSPEQRIVTRIFELRDGEKIECVYTVLPPTEAGKPERLGRIILRKNGKEIDLRMLAGISQDIPILLTNERKDSVIYAREGNKRKVQHVSVNEPVTFENIAVLLHELGHVAQTDEFDDPLQHVEIENIKLLKTLAYRTLELTSTKLSLLRVAQDLFSRITVKDIRPRFLEEFFRLKSALESINILALEEKYQKVLHDKFLITEKYAEILNRTDELDKDVYLAELAKFRKHEEDIFIDIPLDRIRFFLAEPIRALERDATRRALIWMQEIGRQLGLSSLRDNSDQGSEWLFAGLETYTHNCVLEKSLISLVETVGS